MHRRVLLYGKPIAHIGPAEKADKKAVEMSSQALRTPCRSHAHRRQRPGGSGAYVCGDGGNEGSGPSGSGECRGTVRDAGVTTVMITGDHVDTAFAIGKQLGISEPPGAVHDRGEVSHLPEERFSEEAGSGAGVCQGVAGA